MIMSEAKILRGPEQTLPTYSFGKLLFNNLRNGGSRVAMVDAASGEDTTYKEITERAIYVARYLKKIGLKPGDVISVSSENNLHFSVPTLAGIFSGITVAPLNHSYIPREFVHSMNISKPKVIFCSVSVVDNILKAVKEVKFVQKVIVLNKCDRLPKNVLQLQDIFDFRSIENYEVAQVEPNHPIVILCSSGTTGLPKGVMLSHRNLHAAYKYTSHPGFGDFHSSKIGMALLPFYHAYGFITQLIALGTNMKLVVLPKFEEKLFLNAIQKYRITFATLVPPLVLMLSKSPTVDKYDISSLKEILCGAAPLSKELQDAVIKRLNIRVRQGYGMTEMTLAVSLVPPVINKSGTVGVLVPGVDCKIVDTETGITLGPNETGELCCRGQQVMLCYVGNASATAATIDKDGWLHTGDVAYYDENGYLYIVDRQKELIKYKGFQVPPAELEAILLTHQQILECGVIGKPDESGNELAVAFVVKRPNATITEKDVIDFVAENVSYAKRLHGGVRFVDTIPKNATGKVLRRILRDQLKETKSKL